MTCDYQNTGKRFSQLIEQVGAWSERNFGSQRSRALRIVRSFADSRHISICDYSDQTIPASQWDVICLNDAACFLGIVEEFGEMAEAVITDDLHLVRDAVADVHIYLADFYHRSKTPIAIRWSEVDVKLDVECPVTNVGGSATFVIRKLGQLAHAVLKRHQGIRGYDKDEKYVPEANHAIEDLIVAAGRLLSLAKQSRARQEGLADVLTYSAVDAAEMLTITEKEWERVSKRNWTSKPATGV